jgi:hypothetical protein
VDVPIPTLILDKIANKIACMGKEIASPIQIHEKAPFLVLERESCCIDCGFSNAIIRKR